MVSVVTAATAATIKKPVAEDDFESQQKPNVRQPEMCVDYLSYTFDEMDLAASWRVMTKQKKEVVDGIRLENASWRTWAKQRNNLKTISPQTLNWLKDSDVTWLYGPLHTVIRTEEDPFLTPRKSTAEETLGLMIPPQQQQRHHNTQKPMKAPLKSALKRVTTADLLKRSASELMDITSDQHKRSISISEANNELHAVSPNILATYRQPRLRFNHQVEQCIALTDEEREHEDIEDDDDDDDIDDDDDDDEIDSDEDTDQIQIIHYNERRQSIKKIAPARLKKSQSDADTDDVSSISSTSTASSVGFITRSPIVSSPAAGQFEDTDEDEVLSFYDRPSAAQQSNTITSKRPPTIIRPSYSSSSNSITQPYKEKTNIAEPALVTMHQTATDIQKDSGTNSPTLIHNIAHWAASYLWPGDNNRSRPSPRSSVSASIIPIPTSAAIPIQKHYAPTSSNSSSL